MFRRKRHLIAVAVVTPVALLLAACSASNSTDTSTQSIADVTKAQLNGVTISTADFFGDCSDSVGGSTDLSKAVDECTTFQTLLNKFNAENEFGINVEQRGADWKSFYDSLNASFAAKNPPDVTIMHQANIPDYSSRDLLLPLDELYSVVGVDIGDITGPAEDAVTFDGTKFAVPFDEHANLVHLNMDLMKQAGLVNLDGSPVLPTSPQELVDQATQFKAATGKQYIAWANDFNIPWRMFYTFMAQQGVQAFTSDGKVNLDTPEARTALTELSDLYSSGIADSSQTYDASQGAWLKGDVGMLVNGTWAVNSYINSVNDFTYLATDFPTLYSKPGVWANSHTWVIPVQQKDADPVKYRAALEFIGWMYAHDGDWALGSGHLSVRRSVLTSDAWLNAPQRSTYSQTATDASLVPQVVGEQGSEDAVQHAIEGVWLSGASVDDALAEAQSAVEDLLKSN